MMRLWFIGLGGVLVGTVTSQSLLDFFSVLLGIGVALDFYRNFKITAHQFKKFGNEYALLAYFLVIVLGYFVNAQLGVEIGRGLMKFMWVPTLYIYYYAFQKIKHKLNFKSLVFYFTLAFLIPNVYALVTYFIGFDFVTGKNIARAVGLVNSATYHAHGVALILVFFVTCLYFSWDQLRSTWKVASLASIALFLASLAITFTRGAWLIPFFSLGFFLAFINFKYVVKFVAASAVLVVLMFTFWPSFRHRFDMSRVDNQTSERKNLLTVNYQMWSEYPVLGIGYGENLRRNREYWDRPEWHMPSDYIESHAHNQFVNVLSTTGLAGLFFFLLFTVNFVATNVRLYKRAQKTSLQQKWLLICLVSQFAFTLSCLTDVTFEYAKLRILILIPWALLMSLKQGEIQPEIAQTNERAV